MRRKSADKTSMESDAIGYMPERFITGYHELVRLGLKMDPGAQQFDNESGTVKKKFHQHDGGLKDEQALRFKAWVDRQLRAIGRDVQAYLNARGGDGPSPVGMEPALRREIARELERKTELKCAPKRGGCGNYISWQWAHCAWCGRKIVNGSSADDVAAEGAVGSQASVGVLEHAPGTSGTDAHREDGTEAGRSDPEEDVASAGLRPSV